MVSTESQGPPRASACPLPIPPVALSSGRKNQWLVAPPPHLEPPAQGSRASSCNAVPVASGHPEEDSPPKVRAAQLNNTSGSHWLLSSRRLDPVCLPRWGQLFFGGGAHCWLTLSTRPSESAVAALDCPSPACGRRASLGRCPKTRLNDRDKASERQRQAGHRKAIMSTSSTYR